MNPETNLKPNITKTVPFFRVSDMEASLRYYVEGLGFEIVHQWIPGDRIEWCYIQRDAGTLMMQEYSKEAHHATKFEGKLGEGVSICFMCEDALELFHEFSSRGIEVSEPFVGNAMWNIGLSDPDGYRLEFESNTDVPEETTYSEYKFKV